MNNLIRKPETKLNIGYIVTGVIVCIFIYLYNSHVASHSVGVMLSDAPERLVWRCGNDIITFIQIILGIVSIFALIGVLIKGTIKIIKGTLKIIGKIIDTNRGRESAVEEEEEIAVEEEEEREIENAKARAMQEELQKIQNEQIAEEKARLEEERCRERLCPECGGSRVTAGGDLCAKCGGAGVRRIETCSVCGGRGANAAGDICPNCKGHGQYLI